MSVARRVLRLAQDADDAALLGVVRGAPRAAIIAAGRARLAHGATLGGISSEDLKAYREEIQAAVYRLVSGLPSPNRATSSGTSAQAAGAELVVRRRQMFTPIVLMRRDPRRARMFVAAASRGRIGGVSLPTIGDAKWNGEDREALARELDAPQSQQRIPWFILIVVVLSLILLVAEIVIATRGTQSVSASPAPPMEPAATGDAAPLAPVSQDAPGLTAPVVGRAGPSQASMAGVSSGGASTDASSANASAQALRQQWQRVAAAAMDVSALECGAVDSTRRMSGDPLGASLRQAMLLERLMAVHAAARWLIMGDEAQAARLLETLPEEAVVIVPASPPGSPPVAGPDDGQLATQLQRMSGPTEGRAAVLRTYRTRPEPPGPLDARTLVHEALKGPSRTSRSLARTILIERGRGSLDVAEAVEERFTELAADPACAALVRTVSGVDPQGSAGTAGARAALLTAILHGRGSRLGQIDEAQRAFDAVVAAACRADGRTKRQHDDVRLRDLAPAISGASHRWASDAQLGPLGALVENSTALLHLGAEELAVRRKSDADAILRALAETAQERSIGESALAQAIANARGMVAVDALELGVASPRRTSPEERDAFDDVGLNTPVAPEVAARWQDRLSALDPSQPREYLELAEVVFAEADSEDARRLARQLSALAGVLGDARTAASAALLLAALSDGPAPDAQASAARWRALARRLGAITVADALACGDIARQSGASARHSVVEAIAQLRRGQGRRALDRLKDPRARALFECVIDALPGGAAEFERLALAHTAGSPPALSSIAADALVRLERALIVEDAHSWANALVTGGGGATVDAPFGTAAEAFGVDGAQCRWHAGGWRRAAQSSAAPPSR